MSSFDTVESSPSYVYDRLTQVIEQFSRKLFSFLRHRRAGDRNQNAETSTSTTAPASGQSEIREPLAVRTDRVGHSHAHRPSSTDPTETTSSDRSADPLELSLLYDPGKQRVADIIFVHGLGGSSRLTWCHGRRLDKFWPQQWLPKDEDICNARISTFGYNANFRSSQQASVLGISDFSKSLLFDMIHATDSKGAPLHLGDVCPTSSHDSFLIPAPKNLSRGKDNVMVLVSLFYRFQSSSWHTLWEDSCSKRYVMI